MKKFHVMLASVMLTAATTTATAGGILTNTNQSIDFLRNPARDAAIGLDGVYSNPAGVAFLPEGFHFAFNWQYAHQTRTTTRENALLMIGAKNNNSPIKEYEGVADAPFLPSLQAAYNKDRWSLQFNFSVTGGGGKCEYDQGVGSFETVVGAIANTLGQTSNALNQGFGLFGCNAPQVTGYDVDGYMKGQQYYFGFQLGAAYKINPNLSVYGGLRVLYGTASYEARLNNIRVMNGSQGTTLSDHFASVTTALTTAGVNMQNNAPQYIQAFMAQGMSLEQAQQTLAGAGQQLSQTGEQLKNSATLLEPYAARGMNLKSDQKGVGIAPVIGIDYRTGDFNFAAKYEFKTRMRMKNNSDLPQAIVPMTEKYVDGTKVPEDSPALLTVGAQWSFLPNARLNLGYHHFFDTDAHWFQNSQKKLDGGSNEYLAGVEWDITDRLTASAGGQLTRYQLTDDYMNDMTFVVNSYSFGFGLNYKVTDKLTLKAAYFQTNYEDYDMKTEAQQISLNNFVLNIPEGNLSFTRTNRVLGLGVEVTL